MNLIDTLEPVHGIGENRRHSTSLVNMSINWELDPPISASGNTSTFRCIVKLRGFRIDSYRITTGLRNDYCTRQTGSLGI